MTSKPVSIQWTPFALRCLDEIHDFIQYQEKAVEPADQLINMLFERVDQLIDFPESGQEEPLLKEIGQNSRYLVEFNYKIIYEFDQKRSRIIITDVFHASQDPGKLKRESR
ncbi:type II toxin-antitoxin system RelE/ParE family toxin [Gracilimonas mengyeensis]|uniref:Plasmid stabilization system protein ParE n=1 Tax=Gracilimonas mengyeensis TaxID=1302730 RepID=A0A521APF6_9BACT|nr:type II toxin-antitoxin system RelE/ParE family toxin [Gracilimonas mengyeensis]SMO36687.1 Plasmid stabilization system protein ParE [Gracilimonas mengyeensis]